MADRWRGGCGNLEKLTIVYPARSELLARLPDHRAGPRALALPPSVQHRSAGQYYCGRIHRRCRHQASRRGLVATCHEDSAVKRIAVKHFNEREVGKIAIKGGGGTFSCFLDRMAGKFEGNASGRTNAVAHTLCKFKVMAIARREVRAGLRDTDDRLARTQLGGREPKVQIALEIERGHSRIFRIVEPELRAQPTRGFPSDFRHVLPNRHFTHTS